MINSSEIMSFLLGPLVIWLPLVFSLMIISILIIKRIFNNFKIVKLLKLNSLTPKKLVVVTFIFIFLFNSLLTGLQYYVWHSSAFSKFFLPPFQPLSYFTGYAYHHFWLASILSLVVALAFFGILQLIRKYKQDTISSDEIFLAALACLLVSWPRAIILIPLFFLATLLNGVIIFLFFKNKQINIFWPIIISAVITLFFGQYLLYVLGLGVLIV